MGKLIHINGAPGVGKLTTARLMAQRFHARLLDNHAIYNVGFALTDFGTPAFFDAVRAVRSVAYDQLLRLPDTETVILTAADFDDSHWGRENWQAVDNIALDLGWPLFRICLQCAPTEHRRRIADQGRIDRGKLVDASAVDRYASRPIIEAEGSESFRLDISDLTAEDAAGRLADWIVSKS